MLKRLIKRIDKGWKKWDTFDSRDQKDFLMDIRRLARTLESVESPDQIAHDIQQHSEKAKKLHKELRGANAT